VGRHVPRTRRRRRGAWAAVVVAVLLAGAAAAVVDGRAAGLVDRVRSAIAGDGCKPTVVRVDASPSITPALRSVLASQQGRRLADDTCLQVDVRGTTPDQVVAAARGAGGVGTPAELSRLPHLWVPDATLWVARMPATVPTNVEKSLARSPVVLTTSEAVVRELGWTAEKAPTWGEAVTGVRPVAVDLTTDTTGLATALALRATLGSGVRFRRALAGLSLAVDRGTARGGQAPLDLASTNSPQTPLIPTSEQAVLTLRRSGQGSLALVYPSDGSPILDFPLVRVAEGRGPTGTEEAVAVVASALRAPATADVLLAQGFRLPGGAVPVGDGVRTAQIRRLDAPQAGEITKIVGALSALAAPTRMLALVDVSSTMGAQVSPGVRRVDLVGSALTETLGRLPDDASVGVWVFGTQLAGAVDHTELAAVARLDAAEGPTTHRERLLAALQTLPDRLQGSGGGTALYDTTDAAVRELQQSHDGRADNVVVLVTDGTELDPDGPSLEQVVATLRSGAGEGAVRVVAIGIGPGADLAELTALAGATPAGAAYLVEDPTKLGTVLADALASRA
jgi:hypothetical protein